MKCFFVLVFALWTNLFVLVAGSLIYWRSQRTESLLKEYDIDWCGDRLCFMGITPGKTSWADASAIFAHRTDSRVGDKDIHIRSHLKREQENS